MKIAHQPIRSSLINQLNREKELLDKLLDRAIKNDIKGLFFTGDVVAQVLNGAVYRYLVLEEKGSLLGSNYYLVQNLESGYIFVTDIENLYLYKKRFNHV